jgi:hypothetical protein
MIIYHQKQNALWVSQGGITIQPEIGKSYRIVLKGKFYG